MSAASKSKKYALMLKMNHQEQMNHNMEVKSVLVVELKAGMARIFPLGLWAALKILLFNSSAKGLASGLESGVSDTDRQLFSKIPYAPALRGP